MNRSLVLEEKIMNFKNKILLAVGLFILVGCSKAHAQTYTATDLGTTDIHVINNAGLAGGTTLVSGKHVGFSWSPTTGLSLKSFSGYTEAYVLGSDKDSAGNLLLAGNGVTSSFNTKAFMTKAGVASWFGTRSVANAVNSAGQVVGYSFPVAGASQQAFLWSKGVLKNLGTLGGGSSAANAINAKGEVAGFAKISTGQDRAFLYTGGVMVNLGGLGGPNSHAYGINDAGEVVGQADLADGRRLAFLYSGNMLSSIGSLGGTYGLAYDINNQDVIVGMSTDVSGKLCAFVYSNGVMTDLNALVSNANGWDFTIAYSVNDSGQIAVVGKKAGVTHGFVLTP